MSSNEFLQGSSWHSFEQDIWELVVSAKALLAILRKDRDMWYGRVLPNIKDHLFPKKSLHDAMKQAEHFIRRREGEVV